MIRFGIPIQFVGDGKLSRLLTGQSLTAGVDHFVVHKSVEMDEVIAALSTSFFDFLGFDGKCHARCGMTLVKFEKDDVIFFFNGPIICGLRARLI